MKDFWQGKETSDAAAMATGVRKQQGSVPAFPGSDGQ
jgi:hypothetical protein